MPKPSGTIIIDDYISQFPDEVGAFLEQLRETIRHAAPDDRTAFESIYAGQPRWEIGRPQKAFINVADQITGAILDSGCGTGENAFFFASRGNKITGIDFLDQPITIAKRKATERGLTATFLVMDALTLMD